MGLRCTLRSETVLLLAASGERDLNSGFDLERGLFCSHTSFYIRYTCTVATGVLGDSLKRGLDSTYRGPCNTKERASAVAERPARRLMSLEIARVIYLRLPQRELRRRSMINRRSSTFQTVGFT